MRVVRHSRTLQDATHAGVLDRIIDFTQGAQGPLHTLRQQLRDGEGDNSVYRKAVFGGSPQQAYPLLQALYPSVSRLGGSVSDFAEQGGIGDAPRSGC